MTIEDIVKRRPVNQTAARVIASSSEPYNNPGNAELVSEVPFPVRDPLAHPPLTKESMFYFGKSFGRLTVIGMSADFPRRYVCRCHCGRYCLRYILRLRKAVVEPMCGECVHHEQMLDKEFYLRTGRNRSLQPRSDDGNAVNYRLSEAYHEIDS